MSRRVDLNHTFADMLPGGGAQSGPRTKGRAKPQGVEQFDLVSAGWVTRNQNRHLLEAIRPEVSTAAALALVIKIKSNFFGSVGQARRSFKG